MGREEASNDPVIRDRTKPELSGKAAERWKEGRKMRGEPMAMTT